jgi:hypothetical protein
MTTKPFTNEATQDERRETLENDAFKGQPISVARAIPIGG